MKNGIRSMFGLKKKSSNRASNTSNNNSNQNVNVLNQVYSPSSSVSSFSSDASSNDSAPQTPTQASMQENRGIFRTLEPVWYFQSNLLYPGASVDNNEWIRFDDYSQYTLEATLNSNSKSECVLQQSSLGSCTILFKPLPPKPLKSGKKERHSMMALSATGREQYASMPTLHTNRAVGRTFELNKQIRRTISPAWWFEQDSPDGSKGMCRFDYKNQVRLEALSEGRTRLVLTDDAFDVPFTVVLEAPKHRELKEEVRGFLYLEPVSSAFQIAYDATRSENKFNEYINSQEGQEEIYGTEFDDQWAPSLVRRFSV